MTALYQYGPVAQTMFRLADNAGIPTDPGNRDYQTVLAYIAAGNTMLAAAVVPNPTTILSASYIGRFASGELTSWQDYILTGSTTGTAIVLGANVGGATWSWFWTVAIGPTVTLTAAVTTTAHAALVSAGILTQARSTAILTP